MEIILFILVIFFFAVVLPNIIQKSKEAVSTATGGAIGGGLQFRARTDSIKDTRVIFLEIKGEVHVPVDGYPVNYAISANDITGGEENFIICALDEYQASNVPVLHVADSQKIPHSHSMIKDWIPLAIIPIEALTFAKKGRREIQFELKWADMNSPTRKQSLALDVIEFGYLERKENRKKYDELCVKLAFAVSTSDGEIHKDEAQMIKKWVQNRVDLTDDESFKAKMMSLIKKEVEYFESNKQEANKDVDHICREILNISSVAERYDLIELLMKLTSADKVADQRELALLNKITMALEIDEDKMRSMRDQHIPANIISTDDDKDVDSLLGIKKSMSDSEIKKHLRAEYRKWNSLANHPDKEKREQAEHMLKLIGERRSQTTNINA